MDIDMDIDLGPLNDSEDILDPTAPEVLQDERTSSGRHSTSTTNTEQPVAHKVHIRGVDDLTTDDIIAFSFEHFPSEPIMRVEWIDDTSANIVFETPEVASKALAQFSQHNNQPELFPLQVRAAKALSTHPELRLHVRTACVTDQKRPRAHEASKFYMMHPEHDPRERHRQRPNRHNNHNHFHNRRYSEEEHQRRRHKDEEEGFDPSMYDDDKPFVTREPETRHLSERNEDTRYLQRREDAHGPNPNHRFRLQRDRSTSPDKQDNHHLQRLIRTPPPSSSLRDTRLSPYANDRKELFPLKVALDKNIHGKGNDLVSNQMLAAGLKQELFPHHRRIDASDAADRTADLFATGLCVPFADGSKASYGWVKLSESSNIFEPRDTQKDGLGISKTAEPSVQGFSIRGAGTIKELFPGKTIGNAGKELFAEKLKSKRGRRNKAEDMFY